MTSYSARCFGSEGTLDVDDDGLAFGDWSMTWDRVDGLRAGEREVEFAIGTGMEPGTESVVVDRLGAAYDACLDEIIRCRAEARQSILGRGATAPDASFISRPSADTVVDVRILPSGLVVEPRDGTPGRFLPWGLVSDIRREGHRYVISTRGVESLTVGGLGPRTDDFGIRAQAAREATAADDGWGTPHVGAVPAGVEALIAEAADARDIRWRSGGEERSYLLVRRGERTILEPLDVEDHATFVFGSGDMDRVNAALLLIGFSRDVLWNDESTLGALATMLRTSPEARWLRGGLVERIVHDDRWSQRIQAIG